MKTEKKLIACSIIAIIIGICSVTPLGFMMSATAKTNTPPETLSSKPWFSINVPYSYWMTRDGKLDWVEPDPEIDESRLVSSQYLIALNLTLNVDARNYPADARVEYYEIDVESDKQHIENICWFVGTNLKSDAFDFSDFMQNFHFARDDWFDTYNFDGGNTGLSNGVVHKNWEADVSLLWRVGRGGSGTINSSGTSDMVTALREAETLTITIRRIGWVTFTSNSTTVSLANNEIVEQVHLEQFGEGFLYNNVLTEEELATTDLSSPPLDFYN